MFDKIKSLFSKRTDDVPLKKSELVCNKPVTLRLTADDPKKPKGVFGLTGIQGFTGTLGAIGGGHTGIVWSGDTGIQGYRGMCGVTGTPIGVKK